MIDATTPESVTDEEQLARFVMFKGWIRADGTVRQDAFIPPSDLNLSVTRHAELTLRQLWDRGYEVAARLAKSLCGRADVTTQTVRVRAALDVVMAPLVENPEHAHIIGWPTDKAAQKAAAQQVAAAARYTAVSAT